MTVTVLQGTVMRFHPGDEVFGELGEAEGAFAEYVHVPENVVESKPANRSHPQSVVAFTLRPSAADRAHHHAQQGEPGRAEGPCRVGKGEAGHRSDLSTEPSAGGHSLRRKGARASQGRHHSLKESLSIVRVNLTLGDERTLHARNPLTRLRPVCSAVECSAELASDRGE